MQDLQFNAIPGSMPAGLPSMPPQGPMGGAGAPPPSQGVAMPMPAGPPPGLSAALPAVGGPPMGGMAAPPMPMTPADMQYQAVTQEDGTVLLHVLKPDGQLGPVVKIVPAPKNQMMQAGGAPQGAPMPMR